MENKGNQLLTIYGCRKSKSGTRLNLTLVRNEGDEVGKEFFTACIKLDNSGKVKVKEGKTKNGEDVYLLAVPVLTDKKPDTKKADAKKSKDDNNGDLPF